MGKLSRRGFEALVASCVLMVYFGPAGSWQQTWCRRALYITLGVHALEFIVVYLILRLLKLRLVDLPLTIFYGLGHWYPIYKKQQRSSRVAAASLKKMRAL
tara:strand:+ start:288 stop:590 length:303 start_codon:yes stop_codon:yes gene_type:complete